MRARSAAVNRPMKTVLPTKLADALFGAGDVFGLQDTVRKFVQQGFAAALADPVAD
jgi:hypothetical protein